MKKDETNAKVLAQLQEYAQLYFEAIVEANTKNGKCDLKSGKYSAKEMEDGDRLSKTALGSPYVWPQDTMFDEEVAIAAGNFKCKFPYRQIFAILAKWEKMMRAGKLATVFELGDTEEKNAKVLLNETTELGRYKEKRVRVQRIVGNWWAPRKLKQNAQTPIYYELNGVMFAPGRFVWNEEGLHSDRTKDFCEKYDNAKIIELLLAQVNAGSYFEEVATRAGITGEKQDEGKAAATATSPAADTQAGNQVEAAPHMENPNKFMLPIRAKVLQYQSDGNTLTEKWETLTKLTEGIYYTTEDDGYGSPIHRIVFEGNGVFWWSRQELSLDELNAENCYCQRIIEKRRNYFADIADKAATNGFISTLEIEVHKRLGKDIAPLAASREAYLKQREEEERQKAEDAARRERERIEAEKRRSTELLADGKEKLLNHEKITVEQIELLAESVGYKINIRTLGTLRRRVSMVEVGDDGAATVYGAKQSRGLDGAFQTIYDIYNILKSEAEEVTQQPATATETPQIPTSEPQTAECPAEGEHPTRIDVHEYTEQLGGQTLILYRYMLEVDTPKRRGEACARDAYQRTILAMSGKCSPANAPPPLALLIYHVTRNKHKQQTLTQKQIDKLCQQNLIGRTSFAT